MELAEKCEKVLKLQNEFDEKYLPSIPSKTHEHLEYNDGHPGPRTNDNPARNLYNNGTSNYIYNVPTSERVSNSRIEEDRNQSIWDESEIKSKEINGVFFAKPINITADVDQKEDITKYFVDEKMNEETQARY